jgi:hypothetical protein
MEQVRNATVAPFKELIAQRQVAEQDRALRKNLIWLTDLCKFPWSFSRDEKSKAMEAVRDAVEHAPAGMPESKLEKIRDQALQPFLDADARRKQKADLIDGGLKEILPYLSKLIERGWEFDGQTNVAIEQGIKGLIREQLDEDLTGDESPEEVRKEVRRLVRSELDIA